ncbi:hypothetical protein WME90_17580 [Sorangium sp. So ce375]|uniref:hypothetical protein n=1 Tax=Sorangium sp. So ce375 TaxID=3133306 RepID=UPI003F5C9627
MQGEAEEARKRTETEDGAARVAAVVARTARDTAQRSESEVRLAQVKATEEERNAREAAEVAVQSERAWEALIERTAGTFKETLK